MTRSARLLTVSLALLPALALAANRGGSDVADPMGTRGTVMTALRYDLWEVNVPVPGVPQGMRGAAPSVALSTDLYGRYLGFSLFFRALSTRDIMAGERKLENSELSAIEVHPDFNVTIVNGNGVFLSAGAGVDVRLNALNFNEDFSKSVSTWLSVVPGANVRARFFAGPNLYATATAFAGPATLAGVYVSAGQATPSIPPSPGAGVAPFFEKGDLHSHLVLSGMASVSYRPMEWLAASVGVAYRRAAFKVRGPGNQERGDALEMDLQPFAGIDLLY